jgi:hypothetical protein
MAASETNATRIFVRAAIYSLLVNVFLVIMKLTLSFST